MELVWAALLITMGGYIVFRMLQGRRKYKDVQRRLEKATTDEEQAAVALDYLPADSPDVAVRVARGWALLLTGKTDEGLAEMKREGGTLPYDPRARLETWLGMARAFSLTNGDLTQATALVAKVKHAMSQLPTKWHAPLEAQLAEIEGWMHLHRGQALHALGCFDRAVEQPTRKPHIDAARLYGRACALLELGKSEQGRAALEDAAALGPDQPNVSRAHALLEEMKFGKPRARET